MVEYPVLVSQVPRPCLAVFWRDRAGFSYEIGISIGLF